MTISSETTKQTFVGNGAQTVFGYTFLLPTTAQYALYYVDADGTIFPVAQADYTLTGIGNPAGGNLTYTRGGSPIDSGTSITLVRDIPYTQQTELTNQGAFYPNVVEGGMDRIVEQIQQLNTLMGLAFKAPITNANVANVPTAAVRANTWAYWDASGNLVGSATAGPGTNLGNLEIEGDQSILATPVGNAVDTYSSFVLTGETAQDNEREFLASIGFVSNRGEAASSPERDKVALYVGMVAEEDTGDVWTLNSVTTLSAGGVVDYNAFGYELDFNNLNAHRGDTAGAGGLAAPVGYGLGITGVAAYRSTSAMLISGSSNMWNRGITIFNTVQAGIQDFSESDALIDARGLYGTAIIDLSNALNPAGDTAIMLPEGLFIDSAVDGRVIGYDTGVLTIGGGSAPAFIDLTTHFSPATNNAVQLGSSGFRWSEVFAVNGTINTSDVREKNEIAPMRPMTEVLRRVAPITFRFNQGGAVQEKVKVQKRLPVYEEVELEVPRVVVQDGAARVVKEWRRQKRRVMDTVPVLDENGRQIVDWTKPVVGRSGRVIRGPQPVPRVHHIPRMAEQEVEETRTVARAGVRTHYGFSAADFRAAFEGAGLGDFGGFVRGEDGTEGLRDHQITAVLWQIVKELDTRLSAVEDDI